MIQNARTYVQDQGGMVYVTIVEAMMARGQRGRPDKYRGVLSTYRVPSHTWAELEDIRGTIAMMEMLNISRYSGPCRDEIKKYEWAENYANYQPHWISILNFQRGQRCVVDSGPSIKHRDVWSWVTQWEREQSQHNWRYVPDEERAKVLRNQTVKTEMENLFMWRILTDDQPKFED